MEGGSGVNILKRKCDACWAVHESDDTAYHSYGVFTDMNGDRLDVCPECARRLLAPGVEMRFRVAAARDAEEAVTVRGRKAAAA